MTYWNYRYSTNHQVVIDADTRLVVVVGRPLPGNRNDCKTWEESGAKAAVGKTVTIAGGGCPGTGLVISHRRERGKAELPDWKEEHNKSHKQVRARVEHVFARMKTWKILRDCRLKGDGVHHAMLGIALDACVGNALAQGPPDRVESFAAGSGTSARRLIHNEGTRDALLRETLGRTPALPVRRSTARRCPGRPAARPSAHTPDLEPAIRMPIWSRLPTGTTRDIQKRSEGIQYMDDIFGEIIEEIVEDTVEEVGGEFAEEVVEDVVEGLFG